MKILVELLKTQKLTDRIPIWFMRQAGRYLPEYRELRKAYKNFLHFCFDPKGAAEATLQPLRRFDLDAAIIFSDILVIPHALGQKVEFIEGHGPQLEPLRSRDDLKKLSLSKLPQTTTKTQESLTCVKEKLDKTKALIGFAGGPWTVMCYMIEGKGSKTFDEVRRVIAHDLPFFRELLSLVTEATALYLIDQAKAGADVLKIFDSWAGQCPSWLVTEALLLPVSTVIDRVRAVFPETPILYFPKGAGEKSIGLAQAVKADGIALDYCIDPTWVLSQPWQGLTLQGGLDPMVMAAGGEVLQQEIRRYLTLFRDTPYIFNMGHGMIPEMPIEHVTQTIEAVRMWEKENQKDENSCCIAQSGRPHQS